MKQNNQGMTLIEVVAAFAILGFLSASIFSMILTGTKTYTRLTDTIKVQYNTQLVSAKIEKQLLNCKDGIYWEENRIVVVEDSTAHVYHLNPEDNTLYYGTGLVRNWGPGTEIADVDWYKLAENVQLIKIADAERQGNHVSCLHLQIKMERNGKISVVDKTLFLRNEPYWRHVYTSLYNR